VAAGGMTAAGMLADVLVVSVADVVVVVRTATSR
jgi:hypothetical protein